MPLTFRLRVESSIPLEVDSLQLSAIREQSVADVARTLIYRGNEQLPCGDFFDISGSAAEDQTLVWEGNCHKVKLIGAHLSEGTIRVEGNAGMHLGAEMTGGQILCSGDAADWVGAEMHGGRIHVRGNAGHLIGAVYRGGRKGMTGGEILVEGNVGNEVGHTMRRGLIAVRGKCGDAAGVGMIAGSIFVFGEPGIRHGAGMKRGTIALLDPGSTPEILPTFRYASTDRFEFLKLYWRHLQSIGFAVPEHCWTSRCRVYRGDFLELGKGEIFTHTL